MSPIQLALEASAGLGAGAVNAIAGGGTMLTFAALLACGVDPRIASMTSTVGLLPGYAAGSHSYRVELAARKPLLRTLVPASVLGAVVGALVLLNTSDRAFEAAVPWLVLAGVVLLALQPIVSRRVSRERTRRDDSPHAGPLAVAVLVLASAYGSYFGAGLGVVLVAVMGMTLRLHIQELNALKGLASLVVNVAGAAIFTLTAAISWPATAAIAIGAVAGGTWGAAFARRLSASALRHLMIAIGLVVTAVVYLT